MKRLVAAGTLFALALTAFAQSTGEQTVVVPASKEAIKRTYMAPGDFLRYQGAYDLSNGKTLYLIRKATRMFARVDEQAAHEITSTGRDRFQALDGQMDMVLNVAIDDKVSGHLTYVDESPVVAGLPPRLVTIQIASR